MNAEPPSAVERSRILFLSERNKLVATPTTKKYLEKLKGDIYGAGQQHNFKFQANNWTLLLASTLA